MDHFKELFLMQQAYATLFSLANKLQVKGDKYLGSFTSRQYMAMLAIAHLPEEETTINNIARKLGTTKQSTKQIIDILESKGYVSTVPSPKDKRAVNVKISEAAMPVLMDSAEKGIYLMADLFKDFEGEEIETLWNMLKRLYRFDGEDQDGFEAEGNVEMDEDLSAQQNRILEEFERRRRQDRGEGSGKHE